MSKVVSTLTPGYHISYHHKTVTTSLNCLQMQILLKLSVLFAIFATAFADRDALYWESAQYFLGYQLEIEAFGADSDRIIAPNCRGSMPDGTCNLKEFLNFCDAGEKPVGGTSAVGDNRWPTAREIVDDMYNNLRFARKSKLPYYDWRNLWSPSVDWGLDDENERPDMRKQLNLFTDRVQDARRTLEDRVPAGVMDSLRDASKACILIRTGHVAEVNLTVLRGYLQTASPETRVFTKRYEGVYEPFEDLDFLETSRRNHGFDQVFEDYHMYVRNARLPEAARRTPEEQLLYNVQRHVPAIQATLHAANRFHGDPDCDSL